jgi:hypothetical protein
LFVYVVPNDVDYPVGAIERDCNNDNGKKVEGSGDKGMVEVLEKVNKRKR